MWQVTSTGQRASPWKCKAAASPTPDGMLRPTRLRCVMNLPPNLQTFIAIMAARKRAREQRTARSKKGPAQSHLNRPASRSAVPTCRDFTANERQESGSGKSPAATCAPGLARTAAAVAPAQTFRRGSRRTSQGAGSSRKPEPSSGGPGYCVLRAKALTGGPQAHAGCGAANPRARGPCRSRVGSGDAEIPKPNRLNVVSRCSHVQGTAPPQKRSPTSAGLSQYPVPLEAARGLYNILPRPRGPLHSCGLAARAVS
jgi:hypothetical protein